MNSNDLLTEEERNAPMGMGYIMAADRLGLPYLASPEVMRSLLLEYSKKAAKFYGECIAARVSDDIFFARLNNEITRPLAFILKGEDPAYICIPWFSDRGQLRQQMFDMFVKDSASDSAPALWRDDPIREQARLFLETVIDIAKSKFIPETNAHLVAQLNYHIDCYTAIFLGLPREHDCGLMELPCPPVDEQIG